MIKDRNSDILGQIFTVRFLLAAIVFIGVLHIVGYRFAGVLASVDGSMPVPQVDTLLYCQAAQRIAEGHPFSFSQGEVVSTGTTSVLYPFVLAIPYVLGAKGTLLLTAGFWLNAFFYLVFLVGWGAVLCRWCQDGMKRLIAGFLVALAAQPAYCAMAQSDTGFLMAVSGVFVAGLAWNRRWLWGLALLVMPWVRPEGMMCALGLTAAALVCQRCARAKRAEPVPTGTWVLCLLGVLSSVGVFALNYALTSEFQFSSVANKGYFKNLPFSSAFLASFSDACEMLRTYFCGMGTDLLGRLSSFPLLGGCLFFVGLFKSKCSRSFGQTLLLPICLAVGMSFVTVATSGWRGSNFDRYLAWWQPLVTAVMAFGVVDLARMVHGRFQRYAAVLLVLGYGAVCAGTAVCCFYRNSAESNRRLLFSQAMAQVLPKDASVGSATCHHAYMLGNRRFMHFSGLYSPSFMYKDRTDSAACLEKLKNEPQERPDYLIVSNPDTYFGLAAKEMDKLGAQILAGPAGLELRLANWRLLDAAKASDPVVTGKTIVARIDVGYEPDEQQAKFAIVDRWHRGESRPFIHIGCLRGQEMLDCGRVVVGASSMTVPLQPQKDVTIVVRTAYKEKIRFSDGLSSESAEFELDDHLGFDILLNDQPVHHMHAELAKPKSGHEDDFAEFTLSIPGEKVTEAINRVTLDGDHIVCGYWFFQ